MKYDIVFERRYPMADEKDFRFRIITIERKGEKFFIPQVCKQRKNAIFFKWSCWLSLDHWWGNYNNGVLIGYNDFRVITGGARFCKYDTYEDALDMIDAALFQLDNGETIYYLGYFPVQTAKYNTNINVCCRTVNGKKLIRRTMCS